MDEESLAALLARADQAVSAPAVVEAMPTVSAPELTGGDVATGFLIAPAQKPDQRVSVFAQKKDGA